MTSPPARDRRSAAPRHDPDAPPRLSVLVPAHDAADRLPRALRSALRQSVEDLEVIVIDDASRDATAAVAGAIAARDRRVRLIRSRVNLGPGGARNLGIEAARAPWIALLDSDDAFLPTRLARLLRLAEAEAADLIADNLLLTEPGPRAAGRPMLPRELLDQPRWIDAAAFLRGNLPIPGHPRVSFGFLKPVISRPFLARHGLRYRDGLRFAEDFDFYLRCLLAGGRLLLVPEAGYAYSVRGDSLTARHGAADLVRLRALDRQHLESVRRDAPNPDLRAALAAHRRSIEERLVWRLVVAALGRGRIRRVARLALRSRPDAWLVVRGLLREGPPHLLRRLRIRTPASPAAQINRPAQ